LYFISIKKKISALRDADAHWTNNYPLRFSASGNNVQFTVGLLFTGAEMKMLI